MNKTPKRQLQSSFLQGYTESRSAGTIDHEGRSGVEETAQCVLCLLGQSGYFKSTIHELHPSITRCLADGKGSMPDSQSWMAALLDIVLWSAETENQKIAEALFGSRHILLRIHGPEDVIVRHLLVERGHESLKSLGSNCGVNVLVFQ